MKIILEIPEEFEVDFNNDRFKDAFERFIADAKNFEGLAGTYEIEIAQMFIQEFAKAIIL